MQCHAIVLDTTGTTYARQQPRYIQREKTNGKEERKKKEKRKEWKPISRKIIRVGREDQKGKKQMPRCCGKMDTQRGRAPPGGHATGSTKQVRPTNTESITKNRLATHQDKQDTFHKNKKDRK